MVTGHGLSFGQSFPWLGKQEPPQSRRIMFPKDPEVMKYISTFAGYFLRDDPKSFLYCGIHEPDKTVGYYGADVSGPGFFKSVASKNLMQVPLVDEVDVHDARDQGLDEIFQNIFAASIKITMKWPNVEGNEAGWIAVSNLKT